MAGGRLTDNVISEHDTLDFWECALFCLEKFSLCKSINYRERNNESHSKNCELNKASKASYSLSLLDDENYDYYDLSAEVFLIRFFITYVVLHIRRQVNYLRWRPSIKIMGFKIINKEKCYVFVSVASRRIFLIAGNKWERWER